MAELQGHTVLQEQGAGAPQGAVSALRGALMAAVHAEGPRNMGASAASSCPRKCNVNLPRCRRKPASLHPCRLVAPSAAQEASGGHPGMQVMGAGRVHSHHSPTLRPLLSVNAGMQAMMAVQRVGPIQPQVWLSASASAKHSASWP